MKTKKIPASEFQVEHRVSNSRFIAIAAPALSVEEAKSFIAEVKARYPDATHHVPAYIIGSEHSEISHCSDDGEPSGTAGRPVLSLLKSEGWTDIAVVVVRYFGGTKLGTGGLVRAYSQAVKKLLSFLPSARKIKAFRIQLQLPYHLYQTVENLLLRSRAQIENRDFSAQVSISATVPSSHRENLLSALKNYPEIHFYISEEDLELLIQ